jgi:hypothetical protein
MNTFPEHVEEAQIVCALRFQGYEYEESIRSEVADETLGGFPLLIRPVVDSLTLHDRQENNFAAFFGLQRYLFKWGGERLTKFSEEHVAFDFLFLHLYRTDPPLRFTDEQYALRWDREFKDSIEETAAVVRNSFRRKGRGSRVA